MTPSAPGERVLTPLREHDKFWHKKKPDKTRTDTMRTTFSQSKTRPIGENPYVNSGDDFTFNQNEDTTPETIQPPNINISETIQPQDYLTLKTIQTPKLCNLRTYTSEA